MFIRSMLLPVYFDVQVMARWRLSSASDTNFRGYGVWQCVAGIRRLQHGPHEAARTAGVGDVPEASLKSEVRAGHADTCKISSMVGNVAELSFFCCR